MSVDYETIVYAPIFTTFGIDATYYPPDGNQGVACRVIRARRDAELSDFQVGRPLVAGDQIKVRASEIAQPQKGGTFTIDGASVKIADDPRADESERLVWSMTVRPA